MNLVAQRFTCEGSWSLCSIAASEGPSVPEACTPDARANELDLARSSICHGISLWRLEGPGTLSDWPYIAN